MAFASASNPAAAAAHIEASTYGYNWLTDANSMLTTPTLSLPDGGVLSFYFHMYGAHMGTLTVQACIGSACTALWSRSGQQHTGSTAPWSRIQISLPTGTTTVRWIGAVVGGSLIATGDMSVDTIDIAPWPSAWGVTYQCNMYAPMGALQTPTQAGRISPAGSMNLCVTHAQYPSWRASARSQPDDFVSVVAQPRWHPQSP